MQVYISCLVSVTLDDECMFLVCKKAVTTKSVFSKLFGYILQGKHFLRLACCLINAVARAITV